MEKKIIIVFLTLGLLTTNIVFSADKYSQDYLKNSKHFSPMNPLAESMVERQIKSTLKKETNAKFNVKFDGYTLSSMKKGIFKSLELSGNNAQVDGITIPYVHLKSLSDYNYIDYTKEPVVFKSDMTYAYDLLLDDTAINVAIKNSDYQKTIDNVNKLASSLFTIKSVRTKISNNRLYLVVEYNVPALGIVKNKSFVTSCKFKVVNGKIKADDVLVDSAYGTIALNKVANLINYLNPLEFTIDLLNSKQCNANIENINIVDNKVKVDGKIFVQGD